MIDLELMTIKELYQTYDTKAIGMMESLVYANVNGCEASYDERPENSHMQVVAMPPFHKDVASSYFAHLHDNPIPGNDQIRSIRKLSPFSDAKSTKDADGVCQMMVSIIDHDVEGELVSIDGVDVSCLFDAYDRVLDAYVVLDAYSALAHDRSGALVERERHGRPEGSRGTLLRQADVRGVQQPQDQARQSQRPTLDARL